MDVGSCLETGYLSAETIMFVKDCRAYDVDMPPALDIGDELVAVYSLALVQQSTTFTSVIVKRNTLRLHHGGSGGGPGQRSGTTS